MKAIIILTCITTLCTTINAISFLSMTSHPDLMHDNRFVNITDYLSGSMKTITKFSDDVGALPGACAYDSLKQLFYFTTINMTNYNMYIYMLDSKTGATNTRFTVANMTTSFLHVDLTSHKVVTTIQKKGQTYVVTIDFDKQTYNVVALVNSTGLTSDASTFCQKGRKFFLVMSEGSGFWLHVVDIASGVVDYHVQLDYMPINMEIDSTDGTLYAIVINTDKNTREVVVLDQTTGKIKRTVSELLFPTANGYMSYYDQSEGQYYYVASMLGSNTPIMVAVDVKTGYSTSSGSLTYAPRCLKR